MMKKYLKILIIFHGMNLLIELHKPENVGKYKSNFYKRLGL